ncbi:hypothetical protein ACLKM7_04240 [Microbacterium sp. I2]|uniref:hypothetical protein n=1 Tax=Microbacterium sp. I2 TaxID=3391826 RepID=UPI003ED84B49
MSSQPIPPIVPPTGDDDDLAADEDVLADDDRPLDPDLDDDRLDSAAADERAATEGTLDADDRP